MDRAWVNKFLTFTFVAILPTLMAHIVDLDEVWQKRAEEAWNNSLAACEPNSETVVNTFNEHGH
ncbi:hypothetical protein RJ639_026662, partial [Escallonia herrerae]